MVSVLLEPIGARNLGGAVQTCKLHGKLARRRILAPAAVFGVLVALWWWIRQANIQVPRRIRIHRVCTWPIGRQGRHRASAVDQPAPLGPHPVSVALGQGVGFNVSS